MLILIVMSKVTDMVLLYFKTPYVDINQIFNFFANKKRKNFKTPYVDINPYFIPLYSPLERISKHHMLILIWVGCSIECRYVCISKHHMLILINKQLPYCIYKSYISKHHMLILINSNVTFL